MNASTISKLLAAIPERTARAHSGTHFGSPEPEASAQAAQLAHLAQYLQWLSPLERIGKDDQRILGLLAPHAAAAPLAEEDPAELEDQELRAGEEAPLDW